MDNKLSSKAFVSAAGTALYVFLFAWFMNNAEKWFGGQPDGWLGFALFLMLFIISACITGSLVLLRPVLLFMEGQKKEALRLFGYTLGFLAAIALVIGFMVSNNVGGLGDITDDGDNVYCTQDAKLCPDGTYVGRSGPKCEFTPCPGN